MKKFKPIVDMIQKGHRFTFIDVGAMGGIPYKWRPLMDVMDVIGFEPDIREFNKLSNSKNIKYFNYALSDKSEKIVYYITKEPGRSSRFKPNMDILSHYEDKERFYIIQEETLPSARVTCLDSLMEESLIEDVDFIKLDTQGSELSILEGGQKRLIPKIFAMQIEVEFIELYKQQPLFRHIDEFLASKRLLLMDLRRCFWKRSDYYQYRGKGQLIFAEALYFKEIDFFCNELSFYKDSSYVKAKIIKSILICLIYKMFDYAVALVKSSREHRYLTDVECTRLISLIKENAQEGIPLTIHLGRIYYRLLPILKKFKPPSYLGWADSDAEIGNIYDL